MVRLQVQAQCPEPVLTYDHKNISSLPEEFLYYLVLTKYDKTTGFSFLSWTIPLINSEIEKKNILCFREIFRVALAFQTFMKVTERNEEMSPSVVQPHSNKTVQSLE